MLAALQLQKITPSFYAGLKANDILWLYTLCSCQNQPNNGLMSPSHLPFYITSSPTNFTGHSFWLIKCSNAADHFIRQQKIIALPELFFRPPFNSLNCVPDSVSRVSFFACSNAIHNYCHAIRSFSVHSSGFFPHRFAFSR